MNDDIRAYALRLLSQRSYTTRNLRQKLLKKEFPAAETESALERLTQTGLLDDRKFALNFARTRLTSTSASPRRVRQFLVQKGVAPAIAEQAVDQVIAEEEIDTTAALERVAGRKFAALVGVEPIKARQRLFSFLCRRGYDLEDVRRITEKLFL